MLIDTNLLVPMTDANQNFSKVVRMVDRDGMAVILKNNQPNMLLLTFQNMIKSPLLCKCENNSSIPPQTLLLKIIWRPFWN